MEAQKNKQQTTKKDTPKNEKVKETTQTKPKAETKPKAPKTTKQKVAKTPKAAKPKAAKQTKVKVAKLKKPKPLKSAKAPKLKTVKAPKVKINKAKKAKKKTLKQRILTIAISTTLILSLILGIGSVFTLNDFAMTTILSGNVEKSLSVVDKAILANFNSRYLDMKIVSSASDEVTGTVNYSALAYLKAIKYDDNGFGFTGTFKVGNNSEFIANYKDNIFYMHAPEYNYTGQNSQTARASLAQLAPYFDEAHILRLQAATVADFANFKSVKTSFAFSTKPFYFGERFEITYEGIYEEKEIYELDHLGNIRKRIYIKKMGTNIYKSEITYLRVNKIFELTYHPIFNIE